MDCGICEWNVEEEILEVQRSHGRMIFLTGETEKEEVRNVYAVLQYIVDKSIEVCYGIGLGYSSSNKYQDKIKGFNERFVMVLIRHIERYLTKVGIDMGLDDKVVYNVTVQNGQAIIANDNANVTVSNSVGIDSDKLEELITEIKTLAEGLSDEDQEIVSGSLEIIESEALSNQPQKKSLKTAIFALKNIKGVTEFGAAVVALAEYVSSIIG